MPTDAAAGGKSAGDLQADLKAIKKELKEWEHTFLQREGRKPDKKDIASDKEIARRYKSYAKLKAVVEGRDVPSASTKKKVITEEDPPKPSSIEKTIKPVEKVAIVVPDRRRSGSARAAEDDDYVSDRRARKREKERRQRKERGEEDEDEVEEEDEDQAPESRVVRPKPSKVTTLASPAPRPVNVGKGNNYEDDHIRGNILGMDEAPPPQQVNRQAGVTSVKANYISKESLYASTSVKAVEESAEKSRPWGTGGGLPENFRLRKSTIAAGPIPTDESLKAVQMQKLERERSQRAAEATAVKPFSIGNAIYSMDSPIVEPFMADKGRNEFQDFIQHRNLLADKATTPAASSTFSPLSSSVQTLVPSSPFGSMTTSSPSNAFTASPISSAMTATPAVTRVFGSTASRQDLAVPSPPKKIDLSAYAKPYDPNEDEEEDDVPPPTSSTAFASPSPNPITAPPVLRKGAFSASLNEDEDADFASSIDGPKRDEVAVTSPRPLPPSQALTWASTSATTLEDPSRKPFEPEMVVVGDGGEEGKEAVVPAAEDAVVAIGTEEENTLPFAVNKDLKPVELVSPKVFLRVPLESILRCKLYRKKNMLDKSHPSFFLYNEADDKFLLAARKRKKSKSVNYLISTSQEDLSKESSHYVAKLRANFQRTNFILFDARHYNKNLKDKGLKELAAVTYSKTVLPREMEVVIPSLNVTENLENLSTDIMADIKAQNTEKLLFLQNKPPRWNETTQSHCLNFGGRVTQPSIKNFQLIIGKNDSYIVMQFGRCGPDYFTLDVRHPMTPMEAFAIALTTFDAYDSA
ncbi:Tubby- protein 3 [Dinochytrium kinnereticum]|nr:Tubby- protein 3 [Dinochytrium kinnereticum]